MCLLHVVRRSQDQGTRGYFDHRTPSRKGSLRTIEGNRLCVRATGKTSPCSWRITTRSTTSRSSVVLIEERFVPLLETPESTVGKIDTTKTASTTYISSEGKYMAKNNPALVQVVAFKPPGPKWHKVGKPVERSKAVALIASEWKSHHLAKLVPPKIAKSPKVKAS